MGHQQILEPKTGHVDKVVDYIGKDCAAKEP
jgi:hypothetical protein